MSLEQDISRLMYQLTVQYYEKGFMPDSWLENLDQHIIAYFQEKDDEHRESE